MPASVATIPMPGDLAALIGTAAERVENRSLLLDKFVFHKRWPVVEETTRRGRDFVKWDEASRWSFMRIADGAETLLRKEAAARRAKAGGRDVEPENKPRYEAEAKIADALANTRWENKELAALRASHTRRFLSLLHTAYGDRSAIVIGELEGRLAINLADSLIQNAGLCLDRLFGLPYIPGSAVKGVCRHSALADLRVAAASEIPALLGLFCSVFGTSEVDFKTGDLKAYRQYRDGGDADRKGAVDFLPATPVNEARVVVDLTNVHFPEYYQSGREEAQSNENPRPNPFPAVEKGAQFAFGLVLNGMDNRPEVLAAARRWLASALTERGLGAKTAAGYGWFSLKPEVVASLEAEATKERQAADAKAREAAQASELAKAEAARKATLSPEALLSESLLKLPDDQFAAFAKDLAQKQEPEQRAFIRLLSTNKDKRERWKTWKKKKPEIAQAIDAVRATLNLPPLP